MCDVLWKHCWTYYYCYIQYSQLRGNVGEQESWKLMKSNYDLASADIASMSIPAVWTIATHTWANKHLSFASWAAIGPIAAWERKKLMGSGPWKRCSQKNKKRIIVPSSFMDQKNVMGWNRLKIGFACIFQS